MDYNSGIRIGRRIVGEGSPTFIIAEIGSNHDGSINKAKELVRAAKDSGADAVKFQSFSVDKLYVKRQKERNSWKPHPFAHLFLEGEVDDFFFPQLMEFCDSLDIPFLATPFDAEKASVLKEFGVDALKVASGDLTNIPLLRHIASLQKPVILSTGMSDLKEIADSVSEIRSVGNEEIILLHCTSLYPPKPEEVNLRAIKTIKDYFSLPTGYSDHTMGVTASLGAVVLGAVILEKHFTVSRKRVGLDHSYSMEPDEFKAMVSAIRNLEKTLGNGIKTYTEREFKERTLARRGVYAKQNIRKGEMLTLEMLVFLRPQVSLAPKEIYSMLGKEAIRNIEADEPLVHELFSP